MNTIELAMDIKFIRNAPGKIPRVDGKNRIASPKTKESERFAKGPAAPTQAGPHRLFRKLYGLYGTGLAQPIKNGLCVIMSRAGRRIDPKRSRCGIGFKVNLPAYLAVLSPKASATKPCDTSCITTEKIKTAI